MSNLGRGSGAAAAFVFLVGFASVAMALDIATFRKGVAAARNPQSIEDKILGATILAYSEGVAESIQIMRHLNKGRYGLTDVATICLPASTSLNGPFIQGLIENELDHPDKYRKSLGPEWEKYKAITLVFGGLSKIFPCNK